MTAESRRVCLIVDHPVRDLDGLALLGLHLCRAGVEACLVPMYRLNEVFLLRPDLVVVNYVRPVNAFFIRACNAAGIRVAVLDTEGGVLKDVAQFGREVCAASQGLRIDLYCTWGDRQYQALKACAGLAASRIVATGCPRYDFAVPPWDRAVPVPPVEQERIILVNTNFPVINPRFQSGDRELRELAGMGRYTEDQLADLVGQLKHAQSGLIQTVQAVSGRMTDAAFVVRPHPFEGAGVYERSFAGHANVRVIQAGSVFPWIKKARAIVHHNCSTAIEGFLMGREPVHLGWINAPMLEQPASISVSLRATSIDHLESLLRELWHGRAVEVPAATVEQRKRIVRDWFHANDGRAAARVAAAIEASLDGAPAAIGRDAAGIRYISRVLASLGGLKRKFQFLLMLASSRRLYELGRRLGGRGRVPLTKVFDARQVEDVIARLSTLSPGGDEVSVGPCRRENAWLDTAWEYATVRLFKPARSSSAQPPLVEAKGIPVHGSERDVA